jgi:hypothetical protein
MKKDKNREVLFLFNGHKFRREGIKKLKDNRVSVTCASGGCCSKPLHTKITMTKKDLDDIYATKVRRKFGVEPALKLNTIMDISTTHLTKLDDKKIEAGGTAVIEHKTGSGYFIWVPSSVGFRDDALTHFSNLKKDGYSASFIKIIRIAYFYECTYVHFDSDGTVYEWLKKFDW